MVASRGKTKPRALRLLLWDDVQPHHHAQPGDRRGADPAGRPSGRSRRTGGAGAAPQPGAGRGRAAGDAADRGGHPAGLCCGPVDRARAADALSGRLSLAVAEPVSGGAALQRLLLLIQLGGGGARRHTATGRHLAGGEPGVHPGAGAVLPDLGGAHAAGLSPVGAASAAGLAGVSLPGASRTPAEAARSAAGSGAERWVLAS